MTRISDLAFDLEEEILSRVPITSLRAVRSTCKPWRAICKDPNFTKKNHGALLKMTRDPDEIIVEFSLVDMKDWPSSIKEIGQIHCPVKVWQVYSVCDGLLLCVDDINNQLLLWNPYLAQTRYIKAFVDMKCSYVLGYDNNNNPKILRNIYSDDSIEYYVKLEIYHLKSSSWRVLNITPGSLRGCVFGGSLKGNTYFVGRKRWERFHEDCVLCFDFTTEGLRSPLPLPFNADTEDDVGLSCIRGEQLALLKRSRVTHGIEFWITTNFEHNAVSWTKLFNVDMKPLPRSGYNPDYFVRKFFVDKEKKVAVICGVSRYGSSYVVGEDGNYKELDTTDVFYYTPSHVCLPFLKVSRACHQRRNALNI